jgi:hypothetical protein
MYINCIAVRILWGVVPTFNLGWGTAVNFLPLWTIYVLK